MLLHRPSAKIKLKYMTSITFEAYHGTSGEAASAILATNFNESLKKSEWLGHGIYFFVEGISDPLENSKEWARAEARKNPKIGQIAVLKSIIEVNEDRLVDISENSGLKNFNNFKEDFFDKIFKNFRIKNVTQAEHNCILFNFVIETLDAHAVKHNLYIKSIRERRMQLRLNVPNTTVLCIRKIHFKSKVTQEYLGEKR